MVLLLRKLVEIYNYINHDLSDPRSRDHYFIVNPILITLLVIVYYKLTTKWGPEFMEKREPFKLDKILIVYNVCQILVSAYLPFEAIRIAYWSGSYNIICQPISWEQTPVEMGVLTLARYYYYQKISDLLDTIFFVMRKKYNQVSVLHLYHHTLMVLGCCLGFKYVAGGQGIILGIINCIVHTVMYTYYLITVIFPEYKKSIWWKKYITILQLLQFIILIVVFSYVLLNPDCVYPVWLCLLLLSQNAVMIYLFSTFYYKEYILKNKQH